MESIHFDNLDRQFISIREEILEATERVMRSGRYTLGPELENFERSFAEYTGAKYSIGVSSGTAALFFALKALDYPHGSEIIAPAHTYIATIFAISYTQAKPVLVDVDPDTYLMPAEEVEKAITPKTRAILPVHLFGQTVDMDPIIELARQKNIPIIEDCAQAHGAIYKGKHVGTFGAAGCFSFYPSKNLGAIGDGGAVLTGDENVNFQVRRLRYMGQEKKYEHEIIGYQERLDSLQAAILNVKMKHLKEWTARRKAIAHRYTNAFKNTPIVTPVVGTEADHVFHLYVIRVPASIRDVVRQQMQNSGIETQIHYPIPIHLQKSYQDLGYREGDFPIAERNSREMISLPVDPALTDTEIDRIIDVTMETVRKAMEATHGAAKNR